MNTMRAAAIAAGVLLLSSAAGAQTIQPPPEPVKGYVEGVAQSSFGNVTSQSYGAEAGVAIGKYFQIYGEFGRMGDVATADLNTSAQAISGFLARTQTNVGYTAKEPAVFGIGGVKLLIPTGSPKVRPYVMAGFGGASLTKDVHFTVSGTDVTGNLAQYGVVLGTDLTGSATAGMLSIGGGVQWYAFRHLVIDVQYRYGQIFTDPSVPTNRAGVGVGVTF
ncbi:MAG TPA: outer membrane beta-barrel protein [bacterium]|nr:outer membrane beta-barrel protein [bacterium]